MQYAIVGAGPAGVSAAETLRAREPKSEVVLIGAELEPAYSRMAIPYLLAGQIEESGTYLRHEADHFARLGIRQVQDRVISIDPERRILALAHGGSVGYGRLLLASGSRAITPPVPGLKALAIHHCWTLEDARNIARYAEAGARVVLLGAGFIGCILMEALARRGVKLTVLETGDRMVPRMMDPIAGNLIKRWCIGKGAVVRTSTQVIGVHSDRGGKARYRLDCEAGDSIPADLVVVVTGVRPDVDYLDGSGVEIRQGVVVDEYLQSSAAHIYAAGDICEGFDWNTGARAVHAIQPVAAETGRVAALNMVGDRTPYPGSLGMNVLDAMGLVCTSFGQWMGVAGGEAAYLLDEPRFRYIKLQFDEERLVGANTLGVTEHVGVLRGLIQSRTRLGEWKQRLMEDPSRLMEAYLASSGLCGTA